MPGKRVFLVMGASSGIGLHTVLRLAGPDVGLVLCARARGPLEAAAEECRARGATVVAVPTDVRDDDQVAAAFAAARDTFGHVDGVVHCAGVLAYGRFEDVPAEVWEAAVDTTLVGATRVSRHALEAFRERGSGRLVLVGSVLGKMAVPDMSSYVTAKWGLQGFVRCLQLEARETPGIGISLVTPAGVDTPIYRRAGTYLGRHGKPPPPVASADHLARVVVRLLDRPRREVSPGVLNWAMVAGFRLAPAIYDVLVGPLLKRLAIDSEPVAPTAGNVLHPAGEPAPIAGRGTR